MLVGAFSVIVKSSWTFVWSSSTCEWWPAHVPSHVSSPVVSWPAMALMMPNVRCNCNQWSLVSGEQRLICIALPLTHPVQYSTVQYSTVICITLPLTHPAQPGARRPLIRCPCPGAQQHPVDLSRGLRKFLQCPAKAHPISCLLYTVFKCVDF